LVVRADVSRQTEGAANGEKKKKPRDVSRRKGDEPFATFARPRWISKNKTLAVRWDLG
jgi:hypothetical protein